MEQPRSKGGVWLFFAVVTVIVIMLAAIRWSHDHPYGTFWDEADYINQVQIDAQRLENGMLLKLGGRILIKSDGRPPAYRLLAAPFLALFGIRTATARLVSLACFALSACFIFLATRRIGSRVAGAFAVLVFSLSPEIVWASIRFLTEGPLYLATSAMLFYLFMCWSDKSDHSGNWIGLGLAFGLGFLAKASFAAIGLPVLAFWLVLSRNKQPGIPSLASQHKTGALAILVAAPWWLLNFKPAIVMAHLARGFGRDSLGPPSLVTWIRWLNMMLQCLLGHGLSILIGLVLIACFVRGIRRETILDPLQRSALGACACAGVPIVLLQLSGTNHLARHITPAVIPLAIAVGVLADKTGWTRSWASVTVSGILFLTQLIMIVAPVVFPNNHPVAFGFGSASLPWRAMARFDQWDWKPVRDIAYRCGVGSPTISYLGNGLTFDRPQIEYPWAAQGALTHRATLDFPDVRWLWQYEEGPLDWQKVMDSAGQSDIVLTAPRYDISEVVGKEDLDNQHNAEFANRLSRDPRFRGPIRLKMGRFEPVEIVVFVKRALVCDSGGQVPASQ